MVFDFPTQLTDSFGRDVFEPQDVKEFVRVGDAFVDHLEAAECHQPG